MARLKVTDKTGLGRLVLAAAVDAELKNSLLSDPKALLSKFVDNIPEGHVIKVVAEEDDVTFVVLPAPGDVPTDVEIKEEILREEAREYDQAKKKVEESKQKGAEPAGDVSIPPEVVEETYALMVGHSALSPSSRSRVAPSPQSGNPLAAGARRPRLSRRFERRR
jgi:hypothetical protein